MVKNLDLEYDYAANADAEGSVDDDYLDHDNDICDDKQKIGASVQLHSTAFDRPLHVCRRLDFSSETIDSHQKLLSHPIDGCGGQYKNGIPPGSAVVCGCRGNNNHRTVEHSGSLNHHFTAEANKPNLIDGFTLHNSSLLLSTKHLSGHQQKCRSGLVAAQTFGLKGKEISSKKEFFYSEKSSNGAYGFMTKPRLIYESKIAAGYNYGLLQSSTAAKKKRQEGQQRLCEKKATNECREQERRNRCCDSPEWRVCYCHECKEAVDLTQYILQHRFYFDQVFGEDSSNEEVYQSAVFPLVQHMLSGGKATCFAYGQMGAGKTHTMLGSSTKMPGLYALAVRDIFKHQSTSQTLTLVYVSFFEIYCGQLYNLLDRRKRVYAREDGQKVVHIAALRDVRVESVNSMLLSLLIAI